MTTDNWQQFKEVFQAALELPVDERPAYLDRVCTEPAFRAEVESLLDCYTGREDKPGDRGGVATVSDLIDEPSAKEEDASQPPKPYPTVETFIDHYQISAKISAAEPGALYQAIRIDAPDQRVAIRLFKGGAGSSEFLRWFHQERPILMKLRHPNIASLVDTGLDRDGEPYLVLEYVEGIPINQYCDSNKLNTRARITLFLEVCGAVQYAHQHLIAHGSLDSKSVLVNNVGASKILNLGIANLLTPEFPTQGAGSGAKPEVLEYASPETTRGEPMTTAADVYSLGVLFYQLLTSHSPYRIKNGSTEELLPALFEPVRPSDALSHISEEVMPDGRKTRITQHHLGICRNEKAATVRRTLAGDLDSIVLKAIQRDPAKRYSTVEQFCGDIQRYLERRPVSLRKNTLAYRARKFITRHKPGIVTTAIGVAALIASLIAMVEGLLPR